MERKNNKKKGNEYEQFSTEMLIKNCFSFYGKIIFDTTEEDHLIIGKSSASHQIDIHLSSTHNSRYHLLGECKCFRKSIEKSLACSFVTVITDIRNNHPDWVIIPVFCSNTGFDPGAIKILKEFGITALNLRDISKIQRKLSISESTLWPIIRIDKVTLSDGSLADLNDVYINYDNTNRCKADGTIGMFQFINANNRAMPTYALKHYVGKFHTGKQIVNRSKYDKYVRISDNKEISRIDGEILEWRTKFLGKYVEIFKSDSKALLKLENGESYLFKKNGTIEKNE